MSVPGISSFYEAHLPMLEKYIISQDKKSYLDTITNQSEKKLLSLLVDQLPENYEDLFKELKLPSNVKTELLSTKLLAILTKAETNEQKSQALLKYINEYYKSMSFEYPKPAQNTAFTAESGKSEKVNEDDQKSKLILPQSLAKFIESSIQKDWRKFQSLSEYGIKQLSENYLMNLHLDNKLYLMNRVDILKTFNDEFVAKFLLGLAQQTSAIKKTPFYQEIPSYTIQNLNKSQINLLKAKKPDIINNPTFAQIWFQLNYLPQIQEERSSFKKKKVTLTDLDQRRKNLLRIREQLKEVNSFLLKPYESHLFFEILVLDLKREDPSKELFYEFLNSVEGVSSFFNKQFRETLQKKHGRRTLENFQAIQSSDILSVNYTSEKLIGEYLTKMFKKYKNSEELRTELSKYLDFHLINIFYARSKMEEGEEVPNLEEIVAKHELDAAKKSQQITIVEQKTQRFFRAEDDVVLTVRIKNIKQIKLKIYEMNMEQFYLENPNQQIDETINLQYLNPTYEELIEVKGLKNSYHIIEQQITVDNIKKSCGFYIVELVGEGITSRAIIRKGAIACFQDNHIDGKLLKFYDEQGNPLENMRLWVNGRHECLKTSEYLIPFSKKENQIKIIAIHDSYAEKFDVYLTKEEYQFDVGVIYNHQSFIVGKKSKIVLHPVLKLGQKSISVENLENVRITAALTNNQNIKSTQKFENVKLTDEKDYILQVPIKSFTKFIAISVECSVKDIEGKEINLNFNKNINIDLMEGSTNFLDIYLTRTEEGRKNSLKVTGFNGESISNLEVQINLSFFGTSETQNSVLKTDSKGQLKLGNLSYVSSLSAIINSSYGNVSRVWNLDNDQQQVSYFGKDLFYQEGDDVLLPLADYPNLTAENKEKYFIFIKTYDENEKSTYENCIDQITFTRQNESSFLKVKVSAGSYTLKFLKNSQEVRLQVKKGAKWSNGSLFNSKTGEVVEITDNPELFVSVGKLTQSQGQKQGTKVIKIPINVPEQYKQKIPLSSIKAHISLKNYTDPCDQAISQSFNVERFNEAPYFKVQQLSYKRSAFYNNKSLSDEQSYVLNRQNQKQFIGNNLEKPRIFLKRIEVRDTTEKDEVLKKETEFTRADDEMRCMAEKSCMRSMGGMRMRDCSANLSRSCVQLGLNSHNNYLALSGHAIFNAKYQDIMEITIPKGYSEVVVNLITEKSATRKSFYLQSELHQKKKDLRHLGLQQKSQSMGWSMSRQIYQLRKGEKKIVSRDSVWTTVSLANILQFAQIKGHKLPLWISQWKSYSEVKKLQFYDKEVCHELNVFIKHHDTQFFTKVVEPFIRNKITKTFVDWCLLGNKECLEFASPHKIKTLNEFEKILLIERLVESGMKEEAKSIAASMELYQKSIKRSFETYKELFDIVLNSEVTPVRKDQKASELRYAPPPAASYSSAALFGASMPQSMTMSNMAPRMMMMEQCSMDMMDLAECEEIQETRFMDVRGGDDDRKKKKREVRQPSVQSAYKPGFKQVQKTKQYTQTTYAGMKNPTLSTSLIQPNLFWSHLATHLTSSPSIPLLSQSFLYLTTPIQFTLALCFLSQQPNADYQLNTQNDNFSIQANNDFLLFVKQVKQLEFVDKFGVLINQRFFDPQERFAYEEDGTQIQKTVDEFLVKKPYCVQTVVTNTSGTSLELQLLMDVPSGAVPLMSHQYVQITNINIGSFSTLSFQRQFYFPSEGQYQLYPANASRNNLVIAKARKLPPIQVKQALTINKLESFSDVMRSGSKQDILDYIEKRNIFDGKVFSSYSILWMLKDKDFFIAVINILRKRGFYDHNIWSFGIYHKDEQSVLQYIEANRSNGLRPVDVPIFEYFPYFSRRTHKFMDDSKSTIRNVQFKQTYKNFIITTLLEGPLTSSSKTVLSYFLLLQDRIDDCAVVFKTLTEQQRAAHQIQTDYLACYLSMYQDYPNFTVAQQISDKYRDYPIATWEKMFREISDTLRDYRQDVDLQEETVTKTAAQFKTTFFNEGNVLRLTIPSDTKVEVSFYDVNLELYFSDYPFDEIKSLSVIKPKMSKTFAPGQTREEKVAFSEVEHLNNVIVEIYEFKEGVPSSKIGSFFWVNPKIKVKLSQNEGTLQVFYQGKKQAGCYVKVYSNGTKGVKFYRDGYTDITGKFKYVLADLQGLKKFSILTITKQGGVVSQVSPPSTAGFY